jgi:hypothetical protein
MTQTTIVKRILLLGSIAMGVALPAPAQTADAIIAKARAYLGGDAALNAVNSVHFSGVLEPDNATPAGPKPANAAIDIIFQKPYQQRIVATGADSVETTALDGYSAWQRIQEVRNRNRWKLSVMGPDQIKRLRANTWENLYFFKDIEQRGGHTEVLGPATVDGQPAVKVAFLHEAGIVFYRYFNPETGRLLLTETEQGGSIREEGEIMVNGLRFPQKVTQTVKGVDAKGQPAERKLAMIFDKITINETFPESYFDLPLAGPSGPPPTAGASSPAPVAPVGPVPVVTPPNPPPAPGPAGH